ncbi:MAG: oxygen-independent coproporphyrinogen III oxidase [Bacteroidota bacterium]
MLDKKLIEKYNISAPRYTSYPSVPYWDSNPTEKQWKEMVRLSLSETNNSEGISIYIHIPYCESLCTYCGCNTRITINHNVEEPYINALLKEWSMYKKILGSKPVIREIHLGGGTPTFFQPENLERLIKGILKNAIVHPKHEFGFEANPNSTSEKHLLSFYNMGFTRISLGIQDFNTKVLHIINREQSYNWVKLLTNYAREIGYTSINYDLLYGLPLQTLHGLKISMQKVIKLKPDRIAFYSYAHVPWMKHSQRKFTDDDLPEGENKFALFELGKKLLIENGYNRIGMDHFALPDDSLSLSVINGNLNRNFMGYTSLHCKLLIGLGVSSISDAWDGFVQNAKVIEEYFSLLKKNHFPIMKGHILTKEDKILRKHILNLMCFFKTSWKKKNEQYDALFEGINRLEEMSNDKMVLINNDGLEVTEKGKHFVRNICMAIDARMHRHETTKQQHSTVI